MLLVNLAELPQPFLTPDDYCACAASLRGFVLKIDRALAPGEPFHLALAANEKGDLPPYRLFVFDAEGHAVDTSQPTAAFRTIKVEGREAGDLSSAEVKKLRNLGYLGGSQTTKRP